jgi:hypothetical protein
MVGLGPEITGHLVRIAPNEIACSDPAAIKVILSK